MGEIMLDDLLRFSAAGLDDGKIKFNQWNGSKDPMELYKENPEIVNTDWLFAKKQRDYFSVGQTAVCFLKLSCDRWLLTTIKKVTNKRDNAEIDEVAFDGVELPEYSQYYGRVIVRYHKRTRPQGVFYKRVYQELVVCEILPAAFDGDDFPGYDKVRLSYRQLAAILERGKHDWIAALESQKAVYLITDKANGRLYVGSATAEKGMLLERWRAYAQNGHGDNDELVKLKAEKGFDYIKDNLQYAILENYNARVDDAVILERERWWKETLQSRKFGYNGN